MRLYQNTMSSSSRRVDLTAAQLGLGEAQLARVQLDLTNPEHRKQLVAINPNNKIPVLVDDDFVLWESHAIMTYLCGKVPGQTLYPSEQRAKADVDRWMYWVASQLAPAVGPIQFERMWKKLIGQGEPDPAVIARGERQVHASLAVLDRHLGARTWISGTALTLADFSLASTLMYRRPAQLPIDAYEHVLAYLGRVEALEAWKTTEPARTR